MATKNIAAQIKVRNLYIQEGRSLEEIAKITGYSLRTCYRYKKEALTLGDNWDQARSALHLSQQGADGVANSLILLISKAIVNTEHIMTDIMTKHENAQEVNQEEVNTLIQAIHNLSNAYARMVSATKKALPELDRQVLIKEFIQALEAYTLREHKPRADAVSEILPGFTHELSRTYGKQILSGKEIEALLERNASKPEPADPAKIKEIIQRIYGTA